MSEEKEARYEAAVKRLNKAKQALALDGGEEKPQTFIVDEDDGYPD
jgi:hypothetical protein